MCIGRLCAGQPHFSHTRAGQLQELLQSQKSVTSHSLMACQIFCDLMLLSQTFMDINGLSSCLYHASMMIKTLHYPTDAQIYDS